MHAALLDVPAPDRAGFDHLLSLGRKLRPSLAAVTGGIDMVLSASGTCTGR